MMNCFDNRVNHTLLSGVSQQMMNHKAQPFEEEVDQLLGFQLLDLLRLRTK